MFTNIETVKIEIALETTKAIQPITTRSNLKLLIMIGTEIPTYAKTKFSLKFPIISVPYSIVT